MIERLVILSSEKKITVEEVSLVLKTQSFNKINHHVSYYKAKEDFQKEFFANALLAFNWNVSETAKSLKIDRSNLYNKMQRLGIKRRGVD